MRATSRLRQSAGTLVAIGAVLAITSLATVGTTVFLDEQGTRGIQAELETRAGADVALRAAISQASNPARQDAEVRAAVAATFAGTGLDPAVVRTLESHVTIRVVSDDPDVVDRGGSARSIPDFDALVELQDGTAPAAQNEVAVQADAAAELVLAVGSEVLIAGERFVVSGTWVARDLLDPRWFGDPMIGTGYDDDFGPFVIDEAAWGRLDLNPTATWTIIPDLHRIDAGNIGAIVASWGRIRDTWRPTVTGIESLTSQNPLVQTLRSLETRMDGLGAAEPVVVSLVGAAALVGLAELIRLLVATRQRVSALYWARGDSRFGIARRTAVDVALAALAGALAGASIAALAIAALWGPEALAHVAPSAAAPTLAVLVGAIGIAVVASRPAVPSRGGRTARASTTARRAALPGIAILLALAAALSVWQLRLYGSPLTPTVDGLGDVDPIAVLAPALLLAAAVLVCVLAVPRIGLLTERLVRGRGISAQLAARGIRARAAMLTAPLVLMALAAGTVTVAATYSATWETAFGQTAALRSGSEVHASARLDGIAADDQDAVLALDGVTAVAPLHLESLSVGGESGTIVGVTPQALADLALAVGGVFDPAAAAEQVRTELPGPVLPEDATSLTLTVRAEGFVASPSVSLHLTDDLGFLRSVPAELEPGVEEEPDTAAGAAAEEEQLLVYSVAGLPEPAGGVWYVASIDFAFADQDFGLQGARVRLDGLTATTAGATEPLGLDQFWIADSPGLPGQAPTTALDAPGFFVTADTPAARLTPSLSGDPDDIARPPILISQQLATRFEIEVGQRLSFVLQDGVERLETTVAGIVPVVPTAPDESAVLLDLGVIQHFQLRTTAVPAAPTDLWVTGDDPSAIAGAMRGELPANTRIDSALDPVGRDILGSAAIALWAAAAGIVLLALIGIASSGGARVRSARTDIAVLRALGLSTRDQGRIPSGELRIMLLIGLIVGLLAGTAVALLTIPYFARAAVTAPYFSIGTNLRLDAVGLAVLLGVLVLAAGAIVAVMASRVRARVATAIPGEDPE